MPEVIEPPAQTQTPSLAGTNQPEPKVTTPPQNNVEPADMDDPLAGLKQFMSPTKKEEQPKEEEQDATSLEQEVPKEAPETPEEGSDTTNEEKTPKTEDVKPKGGPKELRAALDTYKKEVQKLKTELETLKKKPADDPEKKNILKELEALKAQKLEIESELKFTNYKKSPEYKEKYQIPLERAFESAYDTMKQLAIENPETGETRMATDQDFNKLMSLPLNQAIKQAKKWFGDAYMLVINQREKIFGIDRDAKNAIETYKKEYDTREKTQEVERAAYVEKARSIWDQNVNEQIEKYPQIFGVREGDDEGNEILNKATQTVDYVFTGKSQQLPLEQRMKLESTVRNKAIAFDRLIRDVQVKDARISELENKLAKYQKSAPGAASAPQTEPTKEDDSWQSEFKSVFGKK